MFIRSENQSLLAEAQTTPPKGRSYVLNWLNFRQDTHHQESFLRRRRRSMMQTYRRRIIQLLRGDWSWKKGCIHRGGAGFGIYERD